MFFFSSTKGNTLATAALEDTSIKPTSRYSLRSRSPTSGWLASNSNSSLGLSRGSLSRKSPSPPKVAKDRIGRGKKTVAYDPFDTLLKEKKLAEKSGKGHDAFCRAETTTEKFDEDHLQDGWDESDLDDAALAVRDRDRLINRPITPDLSRGNGDDLSLGDTERRKFFGEDGGKAIMGILEHDKIEKREVLNEQVPSLRFWSPPGAHNTTMVVDETLSFAEISVTSPLMCLFRKLIQRGGMFELLFFFPFSQPLSDFCRAALVLNMDFLSTVKPIEQPTIVQYLCELGVHLPPVSCRYSLTFLKALDSHHTLVTEPASRALENHWRLKTTTPGLSFAQVLTGVQRLGVNAAVLSSQNWPVSGMPCTEDVTTELREDFVRRLIILANACTR